VHRVAVDPYNGDVWVTVGDGKKNRGTFRSTDGGNTWQKVRVSQATAVVFTADGIYWGEDVTEGEISLTHRLDGKTATGFKVANLGKYEGVGLETIAGPDRDGWLYVRGFRIRDGS
jgi:hypothetical protein